MIDPASLEELVGARIDAAHLVPETGLFCLSARCAGGPRRLGVGIGPRLVGVGWLPDAPAFSAASKHPLVAAARAHVVGHRVRSVVVDEDGAVWIAVGGDGAIARIRLLPAPLGEVRVVGIGGDTVQRFGPDRPSRLGPAEIVGTLEEAGRELLRASDATAGELRRKALLDGLRGQEKKLGRRAEAVRGDLARLDDAPRLQRAGRMLLAQGERVPRGAAAATLDDWETGGTIDVELDPALPAKAQADAFFRRARKLLRGEALMRERLDDTRRAIDAVRSLTSEIEGDAPLTRQALDAWAAKARELGVRLASGTPGKKKPREAERLPYLTYRAFQDRPVYVGRGPKDNDTLTTEIARPHDLWMHARGVPGAHVVVPLSKGESCPPELLVDAAILAAHHSDARGEDTVEITTAERRYVRKPRGAAPGKVTVDREKVLTVRVHGKRLGELLKTRGQ